MKDPQQSHQPQKQESTPDSFQERLELSLPSLPVLASFLDVSPDALLVIDATGTIVLVNTQGERLFGYSPRELVGQSVDTLLPERLRTAHMGRRLRYIQTPGARPMGAGLNLVGQRKDGDEFPVDISLRPLMIGPVFYVMAAIRDMTAQHIETQARLDMLQLILDHLSTGICLVQGPQARLLLANHAATDLWGAEWKQDQPMRDFLAQQQIRLFTADGRPLSTEEAVTELTLASGQPVLHKQQVLRRSDGSNFPVQVDIIPLDLFHASENFPAEMAKSLVSSERVVMVVYQDVTALKKAEALKDQFISLATHELRTPVTVLSGYADLLLKQAASPKKRDEESQKSKLLAMKEAAQQLAKLTADLLDVTHVQAGQFQLRQASTDLVALTHRVVGQIQTTTDRHELSVQTALARFPLSLDALRIEQVLANLLTNAIKYSPQGGAIEVTIEEQKDPHEARLSVSDHGMGIPKEQQAHLFGRFVRAENVREARISGTGLGLFLCRELVERHGGRIWFQSEEHAGTTFFFTLPCDDLVPDEQA